MYLTSIVFNNVPSLKDYEHGLRGENDAMYTIKRGNKRPAEFSKLLRSANLKKNFVEFLIEDWASDDFANLCEGKIVKINYEKCYVYEKSIK